MMPSLPASHIMRLSDRSEMTKLTPGAGLFVALAVAALALGGCASYRPLPLPQHAHLERRIDDVIHTLPASGPDTEARVIDISQPLTVDDIGLLAILNDPELRTERGEFDVARAGLTQSEALPNPSVSLGYAALLGGPGTTGAFTASLTQDIKSLVTYRRRVAAARAHVSEVNAELLWKEWLIAQKARLLVVDLYWGQRSIESSEAALKSIGETASRIRSQIDAGTMTQETAAPLLASKAALAQSLSSLRLTQLENWRELDDLLGMTPDARFVLAEPQVPAPPADLNARIAALPEQRPDLIALQLGYRSADEHLREAILGQFPAFSLGGSWSSDTSGVRSGGPTVTFDLPIFDRNQGQLAQTRATRRLLYEQYQSRLDQVDTSIRGLKTREQLIAAALTDAHSEAASANAQVEHAKHAYAQGTLDRRALTDYETTELRRRLDVYALERGLAQARIGLALELGMGLPRTRLAPLDFAD